MRFTSGGSGDVNERLSILTNGNVGIGTTSPSAKLHVNGNSYFDGNVGLNTTFKNWGASNTVLQLGLYASLYDSGGSTIFAFNSYNDGTGNKYIGTGTLAMRYIVNDSGHTWQTAPIGTADDNITYTDRMIIKADGKVGIGTTSPSGQLEVKGFAKILNLLTTEARGGGDCYFSLSDPTGQKGYFGYGSASTDDFYVSNNINSDMLFRTNSTERMRIASTGTVKINNLGTGTVYSNAGILTNTNPSDERLKDEITDLQYGLNEILQLRPVSYSWINDTANQGKQFGFIAQEVQEIMPDLISEFETKDGEEDVVRLGLDKEAIFVTLVNAIKEQNEVLQQLKVEIELLKAK